jgi:hypothetical protein
MTQLRDLAYVRSGDKGDVVTVGVIARRPEYYEQIVEALRPDRIAALFGDWALGPIEVHEMANVHTVLVALHRGLGGGATSTLRLDQTGKALGTALLRLETDGSAHGDRT